MHRLSSSANIAREACDVREGDPGLPTSQKLLILDPLPSHRFATLAGDDSRALEDKR